MTRFRKRYANVSAISMFSIAILPSYGVWDLLSIMFFQKIILLHCALLCFLGMFVNSKCSPERENKKTCRLGLIVDNLPDVKGVDWPQSQPTCVSNSHHSYLGQCYQTLYLMKLTWSLPVQDLKIIFERYLWFPSIRVPSAHRKMYGLQMDWRKMGWCGRYTVPGYRATKLPAFT